jgi:hypothetical protein
MVSEFWRRSMQLHRNGFAVLNTYYYLCSIVRSNVWNDIYIYRLDVRTLEMVRAPPCKCNCTTLPAKNGSIELIESSESSTVVTIWIYVVGVSL